MRKIYLVGAVGSWLLASACGRLGTGDDLLGDGDGDASIGDGDGDKGDGDLGDGDIGDGDLGDGDIGDGDIGDGDTGDGDIGDGDVGDGDTGDGDMGGAPGDGDGDETGGLGGMPVGDGDGDVDPPDPGFPTCTITAPEDGAVTAFHGELVRSASEEEATTEFSGITFRATATDPEDGELTGESIVWLRGGDGSSDAEVLLGVGSEITVPSLPTGENKIVCHAFDSDDNLGADFITVKSVSPVMYINHPGALDGPRLVGEAIEFVAVGYDYEDGLLNQETFSWESSIDGFLGQGNGAYNLSSGIHNVIVTGKDEEENAASASVAVTTVSIETLPPVID